MSIIRCLLILASFIQPAFALDAKLFSDTRGIYLVLVNDSNNTADVAEDFILGRCDSAANICMTIVNDEGRSIEILARTDRFDHEFNKRVVLWPLAVYGAYVDKEELVSRFALSEGHYRISFSYKDRKTQVLINSNVVKLYIAE